MWLGQDFTHQEGNLPFTYLIRPIQRGVAGEGGRSEKEEENEEGTIKPVKENKKKSNHQSSRTIL